MSLDLCILASGSSGNCSIVRARAGSVLVDCGIGPKTVERRLAESGYAGRLDAVAGVCLTHLDRDHVGDRFITWLSRRQLPVYCHRTKVPTLRDIASRQHCSLAIRPFGDTPFSPVAGLSIEPHGLRHDADGSHAFVISDGEARIGFATDLGQVPADLIERFCEAGGLDVLAIECNYCPEMQLASPRPEFLKRRIMGGAGHLSNGQAFDAVRQVFDRHERLGLALPGRVALLHRSRQCNCPDRVRQVFARDPRIAARMVLAEQNAATGWLRQPTTRVRQLCFEF
jgi:phosphoribosyl 1,2-cyclic phosphodiesterase